MIKTRLMQLLPQAKRHILFQVLWQWIGLLCQIILIYSGAQLLEKGIFASLTREKALTLGLVICGGILLRIYSDRQAAYASQEASADVKGVLRNEIYEKLLRLGSSYREQVSTAEVVQTAAEGVEQLEVYFGKYLPQLLYSLLAPVTLFGVLAFADWRASLVLLVCVPLIPVSIVAVQKLAGRLLSKYWSRYTGLGDSFLENLLGLTTLKIYGAEAQRAGEMEKESQEFRRITMKVLTMQLNSTSIMDIIAYGGAALGMVVALWEFSRGRVGLAEALMLILLAAEFFLPLRALGSYFHIAMNGMAASDRIFALLDLPEDEEEKAELSPFSLDLTLQSVGFSYEEDRPILKKITLDIPQGSFVAFVGASGSGKSTLAGLLMGKNKGYTGSLRIGCQELSTVTEESLFAQVTLVGHKAYLFKGTVRDNLLMGNPEAGREEMMAVLTQVNLWGFLQGEQGLDTPLTEGGANLSGGQRQRLALARALLHDTPIYLFDEATSNIDAESEELIMAVIRRLAAEKTVILISHRLANVVDADRIYVLAQGEIAESGSHALLMARKGIYSRLYHAQKALEDYGKGGAA